MPGFFCWLLRAREGFRAKVLIIVDGNMARLADSVATKNYSPIPGFNDIVIAFEAG